MLAKMASLKLILSHFKVLLNSFLMPGSQAKLYLCFAFLELIQAVMSLKINRRNMPKTPPIMLRGYIFHCCS